MLKRFQPLSLFLSFAFVILSTQTGHAQSIRERHDRIRASVDRQDFASALKDLLELRAAQPNLFALNNYDYLLARLAERTGDRAIAAVNYQRVVARNSVLREYGIWHLAQFARMTGNLTLEREQLRQLIATAPDSLLRNAASSRLADSLFESRDFAGVIYELKLQLLSSAGPTARKSLALLARAYLSNNQPVQAREVFSRLITELQDTSRPDDYALSSAIGLDALDGGSGAEVPTSTPQLAEPEHLRRAQIYHFNRDFIRARLHYSAIVERYPQSLSVPAALYQIGRTFYQDGRFEEALPNFQRVFEKYPDSQSARDALGFGAASLSRLKRTDEAMALYRRLIDNFPDAPDAERPYLNAIDALRDAARDQEALDWVERARSKFRGKLPSTLALFARARIYLTRNDWARALSDLDALRLETELGGTVVPGGTIRNEVSYLRGYVLEQMGRVDEAIRAYLEIPDGRGEYYGGRATERLGALASSGDTRGLISQRAEGLRREAQKALASGLAEYARASAQSALRLTDDPTIATEMLEIARRAYAILPAYNAIPNPTLLSYGRKDVLTASGSSESASKPTARNLADELLFLGLYDEGAPLLSTLEEISEESARKVTADGNSSSTTSPPLTSDQAFTMAVLFKQAELAEHAVRFAEPLWKNVPRDFLLELAPREMVELLYPAPYQQALKAYSVSRGVDPRFVLSLMRQESRFRPDVKSVSAARGLMQFIPATANSIAAQLGRRNFQQDDLYNPNTSILFGSQYLGNLFKLFPNMPHAVAASYNGGEDNVARWVARARSKDPDRYVSEIGFAQSKDYVYKIMTNFRVYQRLYNEELQSR